MQMFLCLVADGSIGSSPKREVCQEVFELMADHGYQHTVPKTPEKHEVIAGTN